MGAVDDEQAKRVGLSMELKQVHDDVETGPKFDSPTFEDDSDDEDLVAAAHHRFEDDIETMTLLSASPPPSPIPEQGMTLSPSKQTPRLLGCVLIGIVSFAAFVGIIRFAYAGIA